MAERPVEERSDREPAPAGRYHAGRRPRLERVGRGAAVLLVVAFLGTLAYLTLRYSHGTRPPGEEEVPARRSSVTAPLSAERIQELARERVEAELRARKPAPGPPELVYPEELEDPFLGAGPGSGRFDFAPPPPPAPPPVRELPALRSPLSPSGVGPSPSPAAPSVGPPAVPEPGVWEELRRGLGQGSSAAGEGSDDSPAPGRAAGGSGASRERRAVELPSHEVHRLERLAPTGRPVLATGTVVPLVLTHDLSTDVPGPVRAWVARDVYDSGDHTTLLLPRGTLVTGMQSARAAVGDDRVLIAWRRLRLPSGESYRLPDLPAGSADGTAGARGEVNRHWWGRVGNAVALSLVGAGVQLSQPQRRTAVDGFAASEGQVVAEQLGIQLGNLGQEVFRRGLDRPPTILLSAGHRLSLLVVRDLAF